MSRTSQRKQIRAAIKSLLKGQVSEVGDRVFTNRFAPIWELPLPVILIYTRDEPVNKWSEAPREFERKLKLEIEIAASPTADAEVDDILDDLCQKVEDKMRIDHTFDELASDFLLTNTEYQSTSNGSKEIAAARMTYEIAYYTVETAINEQTEAATFEELNTKFRPIVSGEDNPGTRPPPEDKIELPQ